MFRECSEWTPGHSWTQCSSFKQKGAYWICSNLTRFFLTCTKARNGSREAPKVNGGS